MSPQTSPLQSLSVSRACKLCSLPLPQSDYSGTTGFSPVSRTWWWWVEICLHPALCGLALDLLSFVFSDEHRVAASAVVRLFVSPLAAENNLGISLWRSSLYNPTSKYFTHVWSHLGIVHRTVETFPSAASCYFFLLLQLLLIQWSSLGRKPWIHNGTSDKDL